VWAKSTETFDFDHRHSAMTTYELVITELNLSGVFKETTLIRSQQKYSDLIHVPNHETLPLKYSCLVIIATLFRSEHTVHRSQSSVTLSISIRALEVQSTEEWCFPFWKTVFCFRDIDVLYYAN